MAKNLNSPYEMRRTSTWLKIKRRRCIDVEILSHEIGSTKGTFIIKMPSGVEARVSGTSEDIVKFYNEHKPKKMEINYMYLTPSGFPFQPTFSKFIGDVI
jgi:ATP-dependent DNA ligase